jgi:hypothetical protein
MFNPYYIELRLQRRQARWLDDWRVGAPLVLQHIMGNEALRFDGRKFGYLGVPSP